MVLGTGLIGASVGMGLRGAGWHVTGWDPDPEALATSADRGALDRAEASAAVALAGRPHLVVLAGPQGAVVDTLGTMEYSGLVTDVAAVKVPVVAAARHLAHFVGGHPMAGREVSGPEAASAALFRGAAWVLVDDGADAGDLESVEEMVADLGARPLRMSAAEHDAAVGMVSHLPQVLAAALLRQAAESSGALDLAAGSFRDLTRVAASDAEAWAGLLVANAGPVAAEVRRFAGRLERWAAAVETGDAAELRGALAAAGETRRALGPPVVAVGVALADRPGELARVGSALARSRVDVRDLQLRHAPHGGGGVLSLFVRPGEAEALRAALEGEGLLLSS